MFFRCRAQLRATVGLCASIISGGAALGILLLALVALYPAPTNAAQKTIIVRNDKGGALSARVDLIREYKQQDLQLEIRGRYCLSACTMFLSLQNVCVAPDTMFGFHGPSSHTYGIGLSPVRFEHWSRIMATHYPEPLRTWFLETGRNRIVGFFFYSGRDIINMGIRNCQRT